MAHPTDKSMLQLMELISYGFNRPLVDLHKDIAAIWKFKDQLQVIDVLVMYSDRVVSNPSQVESRILVTLTWNSSRSKTDVCKG